MEVSLASRSPFQMHGFRELTGATTLVGMFAGIGMPLHAFALFLPSIIHEVRLSSSSNNVGPISEILPRPFHPAWYVRSHVMILNKVSPSSAGSV